MAVVRHRLCLPDTTQPYVATKVSIRLGVDGTVPGTHTEILSTAFTETDTDGVFSTDLEPNDQISPSGTSYVVTMPGNVTWTVVLPSSTPPNTDDTDPDNPVLFWWLDQIRVGSLPDVGPVFRPLPAGGSAAQVLTKRSDSDFDADWEDAASPLPAGGAAGQVLTKQSGADFDATWQTPDILWGRAAKNPTTGMFHVSEFGSVGVDPATWTVAQTSSAVLAARNAAASAVDLVNAIGQTVMFDGTYFELNAYTGLADPVSGLPYCAIPTWDYLTFLGTGRGTVIKLTAGANCHVFGHPGRTSGGATSPIQNVTWRNLTIDGNRTLQDGAHTHDGLHIPQHPGLELDHVLIRNCDGRGYYSTANGEFGTGGMNIVQYLKITDCRADNNAGWGWFMSATNRNTTYKGVYATGNGSPLARIVGKTVAAPISAGGNLVLAIDTFSGITIALTAGDSPASVVSKINTAISGKGTAALTPSGRLMITSNTTGGVSQMFQANTSTASVLTDLGFTNSPLNGDNNHKVGANEYGGFFLDHSEAVTDGLFADQNFGDGFYIHNVNACHFGSLHSTRNNGIGIYVDALNHSTGHNWAAMMNCADFGVASYRTAIADSAECYFDNGVEGYGITKDSTLLSFNGPGDKTTIGGGSDNRHANWSIYVADNITLGLDNDVPNTLALTVKNVKTGDGGLLGTVRTPVGYVASPIYITRGAWPANTAVAAFQLYQLPTGGQAYSVTSRTTRASFDATERAAWTFLPGGHFEKLTATGSWVCPAGITHARFEMGAGGGGGGGGTSSATINAQIGSSGGGGGQRLTWDETALVPGTSYSYTHGTGGTGGAGGASGGHVGANGNDGGDGIFVGPSSTKTAKGGGKGYSPTAPDTTGAVGGGIYGWPSGQNGATSITNGCGGASGIGSVWSGNVAGGGGGGASNATLGGAGGVAATGLGMVVGNVAAGSSATINGGNGTTATIECCGGGGGGAGNKTGGTGGNGGNGADGFLKAWF